MALTRFGSGGFYQNVVRIFSLIIGVAAFSTTVFVGSLLWGYVSRRSKERQKTVPLEDLFPHASHKPNTVVTLLEEFKAGPPSPPPPPPPPASTDDNETFFDTIVFDPEQDYAQVLVEARSNASSAQVAPFTRTLMPNGSKQSWMIRSHSARVHNPVCEDPPLLSTQSQDRVKSSKSWKKLLFWKTSKKRNDFETDTREGIHSSCATPLHYSLKSPKTKVTVTPTSSGGGLNRKRSLSSPVYNAGLGYASTRNGRSSSGPLSGSSTPARDIDSPYESAYMPLRKSGGGNKISSGPLYVT